MITGEKNMNDFSTPPNLVLPDSCILTPLTALKGASRRMLSGFLDIDGVLVVVNNKGIESDVVNDYSGLAELAGFDYPDIMDIKNQRRPTTELLDKWTDRNGTVGKLWMYLYMMERYDVLTGCRRSIVRDCINYEVPQQCMRETISAGIISDLSKISISDMAVDETKFVSVSDVKSGGRTLFDVFVCYTPEDENDRKFLFKMIEELEVGRGLKMFIPGRDDLPGAAEHTITAYLIEKRCRRVVVLLSRSFLKSEACDFQVKFAHALSPGARSMKLIPVIREEKTHIPRILSFLAVCDFTKSDMVEWSWNRLYRAIIAPVGPSTYFEDEDLSNPFCVSDKIVKNIKFPSKLPSSERKENLSLVDILPETESRPNETSAGPLPRVPIEYDVSSKSWGQPTSKINPHPLSTANCNSLPTGATAKPPQEGETRSVKRSKPFPAKKPDIFKGWMYCQRQQSPSESERVYSSESLEHFV